MNNQKEVKIQNAGDGIEMNYYICETCGIQYDKSTVEPSECKICTEERQ